VPLTPKIELAELPELAELLLAALAVPVPV
jgi:hypothetical protein